MPAKEKVDYKKLLEMVKSGTPQAEIMKALKFNTTTQFKNHYLSALIEAPEIITGRTSAKSAPAKETSVSKRGSVVISKWLIEGMGFAEGATFTVRKTKSSISLKRMS